MVPLWYSRMWGDYMLAPKIYLYFLPFTNLVLLGFIYLSTLMLDKYFIRYLREISVTFVTLWSVLLTYSLIRIIFLASTPFNPIINPVYISLAIPFIVSYALGVYLLPKFTQYAYSKDLVTNPNIHNHPAMILSKPTARGAGFVFGALFLMLAFLFVGFRADFWGFYSAVALLSVLGILDDYQNTHPRSKFKVLENPVLRLVLLFIAVITVIYSGIRIPTISNPFGAPIELGNYTLALWGFSIPYLSIIISAVWIVWIMNLLSWSNGIDGQYAGIIGITSLIIAILALRFTSLEEIHFQVATLGVISAGLAFSFTKQTWFPSKIMWGFGAVSAGLVVGVLSILIQSKVVLSVLLILIPFMDASVTVLRRLIQKKSPLSGDRGHLHHILMDKGWSAPKIAIFYWFTTAVFGLVGLLSSEKYLIQVGLSIIGLAAFIIVLMNLRSLKDKKPQL